MPTDNKRFLNTQTGAPVKVVDPKDFLFIEAPGGAQVIPRDQLDEIKKEIRVRNKITGIEYEGFDLAKQGRVLQMGLWSSDARRCGHSRRRDPRRRPAPLIEDEPPVVKIILVRGNESEKAAARKSLSRRLFV